ncbi:MAG: phosphomethylpyrimidine synthase ThiC [Phycisphaeraceae bacterium]|nr:phosphomethylpyrimidine synthase ThiC [Phycisphaeraceae bacterium]
MPTQLQLARKGHITDAMKAVADFEQVDPKIISEHVAQGKIVIPANIKHLATNLKPVGIGRLLSTKINANIGTSSEKSSIQGELDKMKAALEVGADAMMDLSTGGDLNQIRADILAECPVAFGTVPVYQVIQGRGVEDVTIDAILDVIRVQAEQGVDFFTIHAGLLREHLPLLKNRVAGIVSRGGALLAKWMLHHKRQNPLYEMFDQICDIMAQYDVCFSLGDGLRPGAIADATDEAQVAELRVLGELVERAQERGCQVMVEGPGHVPYHQIQHNMEIQAEICHGAPFYVLGPIVTDLAPGYDHITSAIGGTAAAYYGASFLCYVTPREHLGLPNADDVRAGVVASKIAGHAADVARGLPGAADQDLALSTARSNLDWKTHLSLSLDPKTATRMYDEACQGERKDQVQGANFCTMCGENWCSVRVNKEIRESTSAAE